MLNNLWFFQHDAHIFWPYFQVYIFFSSHIHLYMIYIWTSVCHIKFYCSQGFRLENLMFLMNRMVEPSRVNINSNCVFIDSVFLSLLCMYVPVQQQNTFGDWFLWSRNKVLSEWLISEFTLLVKHLQHSGLSDCRSLNWIFYYWEYEWTFLMPEILTNLSINWLSTIWRRNTTKVIKTRRTYLQNYVFILTG